MENVKVRYIQLLFLYAYLRLIDLSLDRSRWTSWSDLQDYFKNIPSPSLVAQYLMNSFNLSETDIKNFDFPPPHKSSIYRIKAILFSNLSLNQNEILYCRKLLSDFDELLNSDSKNDHIGIEKLRIDIAKFNTNFFEKIILWKDLKKIMSIEHFLQNDNLETTKINIFIPDDFYKFQT